MRISDWSSDVCSSDLSPLAWFRGYAGDPEKSAEKFSPDERWYLAGDVARADGDGNFYFASRDDDVIIMEGYRIGPLEVEKVILSHPVAECAVVATPGEVRAQVFAGVVVHRQTRPPTPDIHPN